MVFESTKYKQAVKWTCQPTWTNVWENCVPAKQEGSKDQLLQQSIQKKGLTKREMERWWKVTNKTWKSSKRKSWDENDSKRECHKVQEVCNRTKVLVSRKRHKLSFHKTTRSVFSMPSILISTFRISINCFCLSSISTIYLSRMRTSFYILTTRIQMLQFSNVSFFSTYSLMHA